MASEESTEGFLLQCGCKANQFEIIGLPRVKSFNCKCEECTQFYRDAHATSKPPIVTDDGVSGAEVHGIYATADIKWGKGPHVSASDITTVSPRLQACSPKLHRLICSTCGQPVVSVNAGGDCLIVPARMVVQKRDKKGFVVRTPFKDRVPELVENVFNAKFEPSDNFYRVHGAIEKPENMK